MNQERAEQYLAGTLSEAEAQAFEVYCLANPEFARQVEFEQRLRIGIREVARGSTAEFVRANHSGRWKFAAAAGVLLALGAALYAWQAGPRAVSPQIMAAVTTDAQRSGASLRLALVRGAEALPALQPGRVRVEIVGLFDLGFHYTVSLDRLEKQERVDTIATLYGQLPSSPMTLEVVIDSDRLLPGTYSLQVRNQTSDDEPLDFGFLKN
jgi:hypothetical protein